MRPDSSLLRRAMLASIRPRHQRDSDTLSLSEQIAIKLADAILQGKHAPGERILETTIAENFEVSRGPVRDALRILENAGMVQILPRRGAIVTQLTEAEVADTFEIRAVLFGLCARRLAGTRTDEDIVMMRSRLDEMNALLERDDPEVVGEFVTAVQQFGLMICTAAASDRLLSLVSRLSYQTLRYSRLGLSSPERRKQSARHWSMLVDQIERASAADAETTARRLIEDSRAEAIRRLREQEAVSRTD